ncbi:MAG: hypothetical protein JST85_24040 [Acidobacteria bacterium]|nr:hypothetical protein [Acidobacteriota bacterium]
MASSNPTCPKCKAAMEEGFLIDRGDSNSSNVPTWVGGLPDKRWWGLKTSDKEKLQVITFRCIRCGYLESYAPIPTE